MTSIPAPVSIALAATDFRMEPEAAEYSRQHGLDDYVRLAVEIAKRHLAPVEPICVELEIDPESDEQRLVLNVVMIASVEDALARDRAYGREWVDAVTPDVMLQIGLYYNFRDSE